MNDCIFCKIIQGKIPSYKVYEDENVLAFLDIMPVSRGHVLVVPKKHFKNIEEISSNELCAVTAVVKKIGLLIKEKLEAPGYNICVNNDPVAGQIIPHLHFHIIPRNNEDGLKPWSQGKYEAGEAENVQEKIKYN